MTDKKQKNNQEANNPAATCADEEATVAANKANAEEANQNEAAANDANLDADAAAINEAAAAKAAAKAALKGKFDQGDSLNALIKESEDLKQQNMRLQADFDNFRKRSRLEKEELVKSANAQLISGLLPVIDNFERALQAMADSADKEGINLIYRQMTDTLKAIGLEAIDTNNADFDPKLHEAIAQADAGPENKGKVIAEAQRGYLLNGKLLRCSMVQIGS